MEKVKATFKGENREINIDFEYNGSTGNLDYKINVDPVINPEDAITLEVYLADKFLESLKTEDNSEKESEQESE